MKKFLYVLITLVVVGFTAEAKDVPKKMHKGLKVETDEFTGETSYSTKTPFLSVVERGDSAALRVCLRVTDLGAPVGLESIYFLTNGETTKVDKNEDFSQREVSERYMSRPASGIFGTASYRGAQFDTRIVYADEWSGDATAYMPLWASLAQNGGKLKFHGTNKDVVYELSKKDAEQIGRVLEIYKFLSE